MNHILIYKTNIQNEHDFHQIKDVMNNHPFVEKWSVDTEDVDNILRVVSSKNCEKDIMKSINEIGYECTEL